ncbi:MAG: response regulator transcription factor [Thermoanaerobaculia bacterium]|nr:response regulator transcription factor [Thermoanaerobaculia bacterium]
MARRPCLLVVDDDPAIREGLCEELAAAGYDTLAAPDGERAHALFLAEEPDLVLTDLAMPRLDGFGLLRAIRRTHQTPILVLSVRGGESDKIRALDLGADDYVTKPFSVPELLARVRTQLRRAAPRAPDSSSPSWRSISTGAACAKGSARSTSRRPSSRSSRCSPGTPAARSRRGN